jgi:hypothetical protein
MSRKYLSKCQENIFVKKLYKKKKNIYINFIIMMTNISAPNRLGTLLDYFSFVEDPKLIEQVKKVVIKLKRQPDSLSIWNEIDELFSKTDQKKARSAIDFVYVKDRIKYAAAMYMHALIPWVYVKDKKITKVNMVILGLDALIGNTDITFANIEGIRSFAYGNSETMRWCNHIMEVLERTDDEHTQKGSLFKSGKSEKI